MSSPSPSEPSPGRDAPHAPVVLDDNGCLATDHPCRDCGYNLRGLPPEGLCPECATPVMKSLRGDALQHVSLRWLTTVQRGLQALIVTVLSAVLLFCAFWFAFVGCWFLMACLVFGFGSAMLGVVLVTQPEPERRHEPSGSIRWRARWLSVAFLLAFAAATLTGVIDDGLVSAVLAVSYSAALWQFAQYLAHLLSRTTYTEPGKSARAIAHAGLISFVAFTGTLALGAIQAVTGQRCAIEDVLTSIGSFLLSIGTLGSVVMVVQAQRAFKRLVDEARRLRDEKT